MPICGKIIIEEQTTRVFDVHVGRANGTTICTIGKDYE